MDAARLAIAQGIAAEDLDEDTFASLLYTAGQPDPDLLIRTSGEMRVSNFLLWQIAYAEIWVTDTFWPDFRARHLLEAVADYQRRDRRYGAVSSDPVGAVEIARGPALSVPSWPASWWAAPCGSRRGGPRSFSLPSPPRPRPLRSQGCPGRRRAVPDAGGGRRGRRDLRPGADWHGQRRRHVCRLVGACARRKPGHACRRAAVPAHAHPSRRDDDGAVVCGASVGRDGRIQLLNGPRALIFVIAVIAVSDSAQYFVGERSASGSLRPS